MKKLLTVLFIFCFGYSFSQTIVNRGGPANTVADQRLQATKNLYLPRYTDTTQANIAGANLTTNNIGIDSCGAQIYTRNPQAIWYRACSPKRWVRLIDVSNISQFIDTTQGNSVTNISILNDSTLIICNGDGVCDTLHITTNITNINTVNFINDSTVVVCSVDSTGGNVTSVCDTITIGRQPITYFAQNWIRLATPNIFEFGSNQSSMSPGLFLGHDTYTNTGYFKMNFQGYTIYDYPYEFYQDQSFQNSGSITSFKSRGNYLLGQTNNVRLGINYSADSVQRSPFIEGYFGPRIGYFVGTNAVNHGSYGQYLDNQNSKTTGIFLNTTDSVNTEGVSLYAAPDLGGTPPVLNGSLKNYIGFTLHTNKDLQAQGYPNTRNDGGTNNALYTDIGGNVKYGPVIAGSSITIINDTTIQICPFSVNSCDTFYITNVGSVQNVTILNDSTLLVCGETLCDTLHIPQTSFVESPLIIQNTLWVAKNGNDAQALRNRVDKPFLTIGAAWAAAQAGDVIKVFPGDYEMASTITLNKSVNFHFTGKGTLTLNTGVATALFVDAGGGQVNHFDAPGWTFRGRGTQRVFNLTGTDTLTIIADNLFASSVPTIETTTSGAAILTVNVDSAYSSGGSKTCIRQTNGTMYLTANVIMNYQGAGADNSALYLLGGAISYVRAKRIESAGAAGSDYAVLGGSLTAASRVYIDADLIKSVNDWAIFPTSSVPVAAEWHCKAKRIENTSDCTVVSGITDFTVQADEIVNNSADANIDGVCHAEGGILYLIGARIVRTGASGNVGRDLLTTAGGKVYYEGVSYKQNAVHEETPGDIKKMDSLSYGSRFRYTNSRMETDTTLATAANNLVLGKGNVVRVSGNTQINAIDSTEWQPGSVIRLIFSGTPVVKNNTSGGTGTIPIKLAGGVDFNATAGDVLTLVEDSQFWRESARSLTAGAGITGITADNAITANTATNVQWGATTSGNFSPLLHDTYINNNGFFSHFHQSTGDNPMVLITNESAASASISPSLNVENKTTSSLGATTFSFNRGGGTAVYASQSGDLANANVTALRVESFNSSSAAITPVAQFLHSCAGSGSNGIGTSLEFRSQTSTLDGNNAGTITNTVVSKWTDATTLTRTSQLDITGVNSASTNTIMSAYGSGVVGIGISSGYTATRLNVVDNALGGANMVDLTSTSTAAASNLQTMLNIGLSGANATSTQTTYGINVANNHSGTGNINFGIKSTITNDANAGSTAIFGVASSGDAVKGQSTSGAGGVFISSSGVGANISSTSNYAIFASSSSAKGIGMNTSGNISGEFIRTVGTDAAAEVMRIQTNRSGGGGGVGLGPQLNFDAHNSANGVAVAGAISVTWTTATASSEVSKMVLSNTNGGTTAAALTLSGAGLLQLNQYGAGTLSTDASGNVTATSDIRLKDIQGTYDAGLDVIMNINPIVYKWNDKSGFDMSGTYIGFSAQNIQSALGENAIGRNSQGYLSIQDRAILATLTNAVKQQQLEIEQLQKEIILLKTK